MNRYITSIQVHQVFHLKDFEIKIEEDSPHLILTGKNGSGKTVLLNAIAEFLGNIKDDEQLMFLRYETLLKLSESNYVNAIDDEAKLNAMHDMKHWGAQKHKLYSKLSLCIPSAEGLIKQYNEDKFVIAFYGAMRDTKMEEPKSPTKPVFAQKPDVNYTSTGQFLNFLSDLKIQEALARNENQLEDAERIKEWFVDFETLLGEIYEDSQLHLSFNYKDYSFRINTGGKSFKFTELSDGFLAAIDIIADLILKMQQGDTVTRVYDKPGIVLIDEIETHLHLSLQRNILKILTSIFPNVQFIVTTHSPFVLSSLDNATAFDLEHREAITDLSEYSYESLAEGYFGVPTESSYIGLRLEQLKNLLSKEELTISEKKQKEKLIEEFKSIPEMISPLYVGKFRQLMIKENARQQ